MLTVTTSLSPESSASSTERADAREMRCSLERPPAMSAILRRFVIRRPSVAEAAILS
jgi:hypothetical protein